jgi:hypothetical protein
MGKSSLLRRQAVEVMMQGHGLLLLDPHGDLADDLATLVPKRRRNDLIFFDPRHPNTCHGVNPLRSVTALQRAVVVSGILATLRKIFPDAWGARTEHLLRYAFLALCEVRGASFVDARDMLADARHRAWVLKQVSDEDVLKFWITEFTGYGERLQAEAAAAPLNKIGALVSHVGLRAILSKQRPHLNAESCMARNRIVIARLSKGAIGESAAVLLGGLLLGLFQAATMARDALPHSARTPFAIFVDEIGAFATRQVFSELLAEARKYGVFLTLATQSLAIMDAELRAGILGNVARIVSFRVGADDARLIQNECANRFGPASLMQLDVGERVVKEGARDAVLLGPDA